MTFTKESEFEEAIIKLLGNKGWEKEIIKYPTEQQLIENWANIIYENNRQIDRLDKYPLTNDEMQQILEQIKNLRTPLNLNGFIVNGIVTITRDNIDDKLHFGKEVSLKIFSPTEIAAGQSRYQIVQQPQFPTKSKMLNDRRGDLMLLINGMPVFHIELKKSGIPVSQAYTQIEKYAHEGIFTGLFSLIQVFVAMNPDETVYFANPGPDGKFNKDFYFHWADWNNIKMNDWKQICSSFLSIPMAHQLIGFYTVADTTDGILKIMRSYQYYAASGISDVVSKVKWDENGHQRGGFVWHTTGSGKTMTSFKSAQLIASSNDADKVIFLTDRIELGTQSLQEYRGFANDNVSVQATENTYVLKTKLKSSDSADTLIVTSIQKMNNIQCEDGGINSHDIKIITDKRVVFIVDECHRSTFGDMIKNIKETFPNAVFFGFTGTPIKDENQKKGNTTSDIFGDELHRYSIADGIRDKNVLGFDPYKVLTYKDMDIRKAVALDKAKAKDINELKKSPNKEKVYDTYMNKKSVPMAGYIDDSGKYINGIEDYVPNEQYHTDEHRNSVVKDIKENWDTLSKNGKFHAIFATSSIYESIVYYRLLKEAMPDLKTTCLFDPNIDNTEGFKYKEDGLAEIITDYNDRYSQKFSIPDHASFKKDLSSRLAHKDQYKFIEKTPDKQLDLLIVVDQMLTGFDSKWINTLYIDKLLEYENIIQAFSRTNRLFGEDKPFGTIRYYRRPHTMEKNIFKAVKLYSGDDPIALFVDKLPHNIKEMNHTFYEIEKLFKDADIQNFERLPDDKRECNKFAQLFNLFNSFLEAAKIQGFKWTKLEYIFEEEPEPLSLNLDEKTYLVLVQRYKELSKGGGTGGSFDVPYDIEGYITEIDTDVIDADYMNSRFEKYLKILHQEGASQDLIDTALDELHQTFATLTQEEQKYATIFLHDVQSGDVIPEQEKTLRDYITDYMHRAKNDQIHKFSEALGLDEEKLRAMMGLRLTETNINEFCRLDELKESVDKSKARKFFEEQENTKLIPPKVNMRIDKYLRLFILNGGFDI